MLNKFINWFKKKPVQVSLRYRMYPNYVVIHKKGTYISFDWEQLDHLEILIKDIKSGKGKYQQLDNRF